MAENETIGQLIERLQEIAKELGNDLPVVTRHFNAYTDDWEYLDGADATAQTFNEDQARWGNTTKGTKLVLDTPE